MTLEEAIRHAEEKAKCGRKCGEDHAQLAGWLKELQERRATEPEKRTEERTETHACDSISRRAVIYSFEFDDDGAPWNMSDIIYRLEQMPSAQPERKMGKWIPQDHNRRNGYVTTTVYYYPKCSECGHSGNYDMNYCPNCGARMEGDAE